MDPSVATLAVAGATAFVAASLHSALGFGFALVAAPVLFAMLGPQEAVGTTLVLGPLGSILILAGERRRPRPLVRDSVRILAAAAPGALAGVVVLRALDDIALQIGVTLGVVVTFAIRRAMAPGAGEVATRPAYSPALAGFAAGALTTSTSTNGPPLLLHLLGRETAPDRVRDTLNVAFLGMGVIGGVALAVTGTAAAVPAAEVLFVCIPLVIAGNLLGRRLFARIAGSGNYEPIVTAVLALAVTAGLVGVLA